MENLYIDSVPDAPFFPVVSFDASTGVCELKGESYMEETYKFYSPLIAWLRKFIETEKRPVTFNFKLTYFNTSSSRIILDILDLIRKYNLSGAECVVNWYYDEEDPDMADEVDDFRIESGMEINLQPFKD